MSRSHRDPEDKAPAVHSPDPYPEVPYPYTVSRKPAAPGLDRSLHTVDPVRGAAITAEEDELARTIESAAAVIEQLEQGETQIIDREKELTALGVGTSRNRITGKNGLVVRRLIPGERYSRPLAEVHSWKGDLDDSSRKAFGWLCHGAGNRLLQIYVHDERNKTPARVAAFAIVPNEENDKRFWYLARLLVTPHEVAQWADPEVEMGGRLVH